MIRTGLATHGFRSVCLRAAGTRRPYPRNQRTVRFSATMNRDQRPRRMPKRARQTSWSASSGRPGTVRYVGRRGQRCPSQCDRGAFESRRRGAPVRLRRRCPTCDGAVVAQSPAALVAIAGRMSYLREMVMLNALLAVAVVGVELSLTVTVKLKVPVSWASRRSCRSSAPSFRPGGRAPELIVQV